MFMTCMNMCICMECTGCLVEPLGLEEEDGVRVSDGGEEETFGLAGTTWNHYLYIKNNVNMYTLLTATDMVRYKHTCEMSDTETWNIHCDISKAKFSHRREVCHVYTELSITDLNPRDVGVESLHTLRVVVAAVAHCSVRCSHRQSTTVVVTG